MIIISSRKTYRHNEDVIFAEPSLYHSYENVLTDDKKVHYRYYYDRELTKNEVIELLEQTNQPIYFDSFVLLDTLMTKKVFDKTILAPFRWKNLNKSEANNLLTKVDMYVTLNDIKFAKTKKVWKEIDCEELHQKVEKCIYIVDFRQVDDEIEIVFGIHNMYEIDNLQILANKKPVGLAYHNRANRLKHKEEIIMYSFKISKDHITNISARYTNRKLKIIFENTIKKNTKALYKFLDSKYFSFEKGNMIYFPKLSIQSRIKRELFYLKKCKESNSLKNRLLILSTRPFIRSNKILICDRVAYAKDNGEEFYRYMLNKKVKNIYYILSEDSPDYNRLKNEGFKIIKENSLRHMLYLYNYKLLCTSNMSITRYHYFPRKEYAKYADLISGTNVFLQHGVAYNDLSKIYSEYRVNIDEFVCSAKAEYDFLNSLDFTNSLVFTGAPRFDRLHKENNKNYILVFFTWRENLKSMYSNEFIPNFKETTYFTEINRLLTDKDIREKLQQNGLELKFFLHPNMETQASSFESDTEHQILSSLNGDITELIHSSKMLITDYSSVACDFAYQNKPVISYQFDRDEFHYETGIDLEKYNVTSNYTQYEQFKSAILDQIDNEFQLRSQDKAGINEFFGKRDNKNNERLYEYLSNKYL